MLDTREKNSLPRGRGAQEWRGGGLWAAVGRVGRVVWAVRWAVRCGQGGVGSVVWAACRANPPEPRYRQGQVLGIPLLWDMQKYCGACKEMQLVSEND